MKDRKLGTVAHSETLPTWRVKQEGLGLKIILTS